MYLDKELFVWTKDRDEPKFKIKGYESETLKGLSFVGISWRKANQIHSWFVKNVQDGEDNCREYGVSVDQLKELYDSVCKVLANHDLSEELLPTRDGFFFGGTDYDEYYYKDLEFTKTELEKLFAADKDNFDYSYRSSW